VVAHDDSHKTRIVRDPSASSERHEIYSPIPLKHERYIIAQ